MPKEKSATEQWLELADELCVKYSILNEELEDIIAFCFPAFEDANEGKRSGKVDYMPLLLTDKSELEKAIRRTIPKLDKLAELRRLRQEVYGEEVSLDEARNESYNPYE